MVPLSKKCPNIQLFLQGVFVEQKTLQAFTHLNLGFRQNKFKTRSANYYLICKHLTLTLLVSTDSHQKNNATIDLLQSCSGQVMWHQVSIPVETNQKVFFFCLSHKNYFPLQNLLDCFLSVQYSVQHNTINVK